MLGSIDDVSSVKYNLVTQYNEDLKYKLDLDSDSMINQIDIKNNDNIGINKYK